MIFGALMCAGQFVAWSVGVLLLLWGGLLLLQAVVAALPMRRPSLAMAGGRSSRAAVLIPAHNEERDIAETVRKVREQLGPRDWVLVVADNCNDATAVVARQAGAEVIERSDEVHSGKGFALEFGVGHLEGDAPDLVVVLDADCTLSPGSLERLAATAEKTRRPVQACNLMLHHESNATLGGRVAEFAFLFKNAVRGLGMQRLGLPCHLLGTGMAIPWPLLRHAHLGHAGIVEDMQLGIELTLAGSAPMYDSRALVTSLFPLSEQAHQTQRTRWEHGHLGLIANQVPRLLRGAFLGTAGGSRAVPLAMAIDLSVPPLALLVMLQVAFILVALAVDRLTGGIWLSAVAALGFTASAAAVMIGWACFARHVISPWQLLSVPLYMLRKIPLYFRFLRSRETRWVRAPRSHE